MGFMSIGISKKIALNAPRYKKIVEPFAGSAGTIAFEPGKRKPKAHVINIEDENKYNIMLFIKTMTSADKAKLKKYDWVSLPETFETVTKINATDGIDFFYKFFYLNHFSAKQKDPEALPLYDWLKKGVSAKKILYTLPQMQSALKKAELLNDDPVSVMNSAGSDAFLILLPKLPEHIEAVENKIKSISNNFFYAKKSMSNEDLFAAVETYSDKNVSAVNASTIMVATMEVVTNYDSRLIRIDLAELGYP